MRKISDCNTPHEQMEYLCDKWLSNAKTYLQNETARDHLHGAWCALMTHNASRETLKMVSDYEGECIARRDQLRIEL